MTREELTEYCAVYEKREDKNGETKTGWWLDGVYLGKTTKDASEAIKG